MNFRVQLKFSLRLFLKQLIGAFAVAAVTIILYTSDILYSFLGQPWLFFLPSFLFCLIEALIIRQALKSPEANKVKKDNIIGYYAMKFGFYGMIGMCILDVVSCLSELLST